MRIVIALVLVLLSGCAAETQISDVPAVHNTEIFTASTDRTWKALVETLAEDSYPIQAIEKESGLITTDFVSVAGPSTTFLREISNSSCGLCSFSRVRYSLSCYVSESGPNTTRVKLKAHVEGFERLWAGDWRVLESSGGIEKKVLDSMRERIQAAHDSPPANR